MLHLDHCIDLRARNALPRAQIPLLSRLICEFCSLISVSCALIFSADSHLPISIPSSRPLFLAFSVWSARVLSLTFRSGSRCTRRVSREGDGSTQSEPPPRHGPRKLGALKFGTLGTGIIKWINGPSQFLSQQVTINLFCSSVTVNLDESAIGSHLVNQRSPPAREPE